MRVHASSSMPPARSSQQCQQVAAALAGCTRVTLFQRAGLEQQQERRATHNRWGAVWKLFRAPPRAGGTGRHAGRQAGSGGGSTHAPEDGLIGLGQLALGPLRLLLEPHIGAVGLKEQLLAADALGLEAGHGGAATGYVAPWGLG